MISGAGNPGVTRTISLSYFRFMKDLLVMIYGGKYGVIPNLARIQVNVIRSRGLRQLSLCVLRHQSLPFAAHMKIMPTVDASIFTNDGSHTVCHDNQYKIHLKTIIAVSSWCSSSLHPRGIEHFPYIRRKSGLLSAHSLRTNPCDIPRDLVECLAPIGMRPIRASVIFQIG
jgi:hypothetical protein